MDREPIPLLLNPAACRGRAKKCAASLVDILATSGAAIELVKSRESGDIERVVCELAASGAQQIIVAGGDGTVHEAVNGVLQSGAKPALGIIPVGTGNDFAKATGTSLDWEQAATALAERMRDGVAVRTVDAGRMNGRFFANGVGIGFDAKINRIAAKHTWPIGDFVYLIAVLEGLWDGVITPKVSMTYDGRQYDGAITLASISNGSWVGGMFHIAPMAAIDDGKLDLVYALPVTRRRVLALLPKLMKGTHIGAVDIRTQTIRHFRLVAESPVPSHIDGEGQPLQTEFDIEILEKALRLL